jgi:hypothetical protein
MRRGKYAKTGMVIYLLVKGGAIQFPHYKLMNAPSTPLILHRLPLTRAIILPKGNMSRSGPAGPRLVNCYIGSLDTKEQQIPRHLFLYCQSTFGLYVLFLANTANSYRVTAGPNYSSELLLGLSRRVAYYSRSSFAVSTNCVSGNCLLSIAQACLVTRWPSQTFQLPR